MATPGIDGTEPAAVAANTPGRWAPDRVLRTAGMWSALATAAVLVAGALTYVLQGPWTGMACTASELDGGDVTCDSAR